MDQTQIYQDVAEHYSAAARGTSVEYGVSVATSFGYSTKELATIPREANLGLSCGNPLAIASLREGEIVIDLGSGAGFDVFLAAKKVGSTGRVIGVDMNKDMLARANAIKAKAAVDNVEFVESKITSIALDSGTANCVVSNCVINLVPEVEKQQVFDEIFRLLKPGGRMAVSDILAKRPLSENIKADVGLYCGCIAGASQAQQYRDYLTTSGFRDILIVDDKSDLNVYKDTDEEGTRSQSNKSKEDIETVPRDGRQENGNGKTSQAAGCCARSPKSEGRTVQNLDLNEWAGAFKIYAVKG